MAKKHSLIIGGTKGIGFAYARLMAEKGHVVSIIARRKPAIDSENRNIHFFASDISNSKNIATALSKSIKMNGLLNDLTFFQRYRDPRVDLKREMEVSLFSIETAINFAKNKFSPAGAKSVVVLSSLISGLVAPDSSLGYHLTKAAVNQLVRYFAVTLAPEGIRVNAVSPGLVLKPEAMDYYRKNHKLHKLYNDLIPLGRMASPVEIAKLVAFLSEPSAAYITGINLVADGGMSLQWQPSLAVKLMGKAGRI